MHDNDIDAELAAMLAGARHRAIQEGRPTEQLDRAVTRYAGMPVITNLHEVIEAEIIEGPLELTSGPERSAAEMHFDAEHLNQWAAIKTMWKTSPITFRQSTFLAEIALSMERMVTELDEDYQ